MNDYQQINVDDMTPGLDVIWLYTDPRGWSPTIPVKGKVIKVNRTTVSIEVQQKIGGVWKPVTRYVKRNSLYYPKAARP